MTNLDDFEHQLARHLEERYEPETVFDLTRICHIGKVSCQTLIDILISVETDHKLKDFKLAKQAIALPIKEEYIESRS